MTAKKQDSEGTPKKKVFDVDKVIEEAEKKDELSYDKFFENINKINQAVKEGEASKFNPELSSAFKIENYKFSGVARSVMAYDYNGFRNFRIVTMLIKDGIVQETRWSDPYAAWEAIARIELATEVSIYHLNNSWQEGKTLEK